MTILCFDYETTGIPDFKARSIDPIQPHIVQFCGLMFDAEGKEIDRRCVIVRPDGWEIPADAIKIHGITQERATDEGVPECDAIDLFLAMQARAECRVAHNESFDRRIARIAMTRAGYARDFIELVELRASYCTCKSATPIVNLPPTNKMLARGLRGPKSASLVECIEFFFGEKMDGAHDALADALACARVFFRLTEKNNPQIEVPSYTPVAVPRHDPLAYHWGDETA